VGQGRVELPTSRLSGVRSNHLSYWPGGGEGVGAFRVAAAILAPWKLNRTPSTVGHDLVAVLVGRRRVRDPPSLRETRHELLRKEVIQPQVPLRLPCYDFTPVTGHSLGPCLLAVGAGTSGANDSHGVTGGVYKARERIHRCLLISDY
jgi:hypothetical protein